MLRRPARGDAARGARPPASEAAQPQPQRPGVAAVGRERRPIRGVRTQRGDRQGAKGGRRRPAARHRPRAHSHPLGERGQARDGPGRSRVARRRGGDLPVRQKGGGGAARAHRLRRGRPEGGRGTRRRVRPPLLAALSRPRRRRLVERLDPAHLETRRDQGQRGPRGLRRRRLHRRPGRRRRRRRARKHLPEEGGSGRGARLPPLRRAGGAARRSAAAAAAARTSCRA
mmetsp:Transcript_29188/g.88517  ORF Transcript_29188/g.88517 Transcript_29188/m.88517 type:complete len:228 (-) Transcript_29188:681-1364(-)